MIHKLVFSCFASTLFLHNWSMSLNLPMTPETRNSSTKLSSEEESSFSIWQKYRRTLSIW